MPVRRARIVGPVSACLALPLALAACGGGASSPAAASPESVAPSVEASASVEASLSPSPSASASASAEASGSPAAAADVTVTAVDFAFEGVPDPATTGMTLGLTNTGQEVHEMVVVRKLPTTTQSFEELLALPQDQAMALVEDVGFAFAEPGQTAAQTVTLGEPGDYLMVCFIPAGTTSLPSIDPTASEPPSLGAGAPHFTLGMLKEFTVSQ